MNPDDTFACVCAAGLTVGVFAFWVLERLTWQRRMHALRRELAPLLKRAEKEDREADAKGEAHERGLRNG